MAWEELVNQGQFKFIPTSFSWEESAKFAHLIDGYAIMGDKLGPFANEMLQYAEKQGVWRGTTKELWLCLFFEHRRWRHFGDSPSGKDLKILDELCFSLRERLLFVSEADRSELLELLSGPNLYKR